MTTDPTRSDSAADADLAWEAAAAFRLAGPVREVVRFGTGHIHDTFSVTCNSRTGPLRYVLQRINTRVFHDPDAVLENAELVTRTLRRELARRGVADLARHCLRCLETRAGALSHGDAHGGVWRGFDRIEGVRAFDTVDSPIRAHRAARAFGDFASLLADLDPRALRETLPGFHDFEARVAAFEEAVARDTAGRVALAARDIDAMRAARERLAGILPAVDLAALPLRAVHNDCKLNNVLFDEADGEALCVIDLDTVMPGSLLADFGDLVRTAACREPEDSRVLERVEAEPALYEALARGYLEGVASFVTAAERALLPLAGPLIALETGLRFLTDHLGGDVYFRTSRANHNQDRARTQLRLAERLLDDLDGARRIVDRAARDAGLPGAS